MFREDPFIPPLPFNQQVYLNGPSSSMRITSLNRNKHKNQDQVQDPNQNQNGEERKENSSSNDDNQEKVIRIGYFESDNFFEPCM